METLVEPNSQQASTPEMYSLIESPQYRTKQTDKLTLIATEMTCVHNCILRCLNAIRRHTPTVEAADYSAFVHFIRLWHALVTKHHDSEEQYFFRRVQEQIHPKAMLVSLHEHKTFHDGMQKLSSYLDSLTGRESEFDRNELSRIMDSFSDALVTHLRNEIPALMELSQYGDVDEIAEIWRSGLNEDIKTFKMADLVTFVPLGILAHDPEYEGGLHRDFPPLPAAMKFVARHILSWPYQSSWKFLSAA